MNIDFRSFTITINTNSSITIATNFNAPSGPSTNDYKIVFDNNSYMYLTTSKGSQTQTISSGNVYDYIYRQIGNETSKRFTAYIIYHTSKSNSLHATATIPEYTLSGSVSARDVDNQTTNYESANIHYISDFTRTDMFLEGWSNPIIDYTYTSSTNALYGNKLTLTGAITGTANLGTTSLYMNTNFNAGTYSVSATDGRKTVDLSKTIYKLYYNAPTISMNISRYNSVGRQIDWEFSGNWSWIGSNFNGLQPKTNLQLTYNNITYTLYNKNKNDEFYWYDGTHLYKDTTGAEIGSFNINDYDKGVYCNNSNEEVQTQIDVSGSFLLIDEGDYKYSITASAYLTDMIDYRVYANDLEPSGLPAIYVHKDSNSNNAVDIYGDLSVDGYLRLYNQNNGLLIGDLNSSYVHFYSDQDKPFYFNRSVEINGGLTANGTNNLKNTMYGFIYTNKTIPSGSYTEIDNLSSYVNTTDGRLSISNGKIKIGAGISLIKVSFNIGLNIANQDTLYSYLTKNGSSTGLWLVKYVQGAYDSVYRQDYVEVAENDEISCSVYLGNGGDVAATGRTNFTVEIIK